MLYGIILVKMNSVDIVKTEADMSILNRSISVCKINLRKRQIQVRVIQGITLKMNSVDIVKTEADMKHVEHKYIRW